MGWFGWVRESELLEMRDKRDIALDQRNEAREQRNAAEVQVKLWTKERDEAQAAKDQLHRDASKRYDEIKGERDEARTERDEARDELQATRTQKAQVQSAFQQEQREKAAMEKSRDWFKAECEKGKQENARLNEKIEATNRANATERDKLLARNKEVMADADGLKDDLVQAEFDRDKFKAERDNLKEVISEKDDEIEELSDQHARAEQQLNDRKAVDAKRPIIEVELYQSKTGRKATPCIRFVAREQDRTVVAVSPPQGTPDETAARERVALLSRARWVIVSRKVGGDGKA